MRRLFPVVAASVLAGLLGCAPDGPTLVPVKGVVKYKGKPLPNGDILFVADELGPTATGQIQPDGSYYLTTFSDGDGAVPGGHRIMVSALAPTPPGADPAGTLPPPLVPGKYGDYTRSGLTATVKEGEENVIDFDLK